MIRLQAYKFELVVDGQQRRQLASAVGSCRFVFNKALARQTELYKQNLKIKFSYSELTSLLPLWKKEFPWLSDAPSQSLQQALKDLEKAYKNFFAKRAKFPRFKSRGIKNSFRLPQGVKLKQDDALVFLPKMGWIRYQKSQNILGELKNTTISEHAGRWYISFQTERDVHDPIPFAQQEAIGIDMGIARFLTLSDGQYIAPKNSFSKHEVRLKRYQKSFSRKCKGSKNWKKAKQQVQKIHARIASVRRDFIHQASNAIASQFRLVVMEDQCFGGWTARLSLWRGHQTPKFLWRFKSSLCEAGIHRGVFRWLNAVAKPSRNPRSSGRGGSQYPCTCVVLPILNLCPPHYDLDSLPLL